MLDRRVNCQHDVQAVARLHVLVAQCDQFVLLPVGFRHAPAGDAAQRGIQRQFNPIASRNLRNRMAVQFEFVHARKPQHLRRQRAVRINAHLVRLGKNGVLTQIAEKLAIGLRQFFFIHAQGKLAHRQLNFLPGFLRDIFLEPDVMEVVRDRFALFIFRNAREKFRIQLAFAHLQQRRERVRHGRLLVADERRIGADRFHRNTRGEQVAVRVENVTAPRRLPEFALRVVLRQPRQFVMAQHLQIHQPVAEAGERRADQQRQRQHPSKLQSFCHFKIGRPPVAVGSSLRRVTSGGQNGLLCQRRAGLPRGQLAR